MKPIHIQDGKFKTDKSSKYINKKDLKESDFKYILQPGDILISNVFNDLKMYVYNSNDPQAFASNNLAIIRSSERDYIFSYLQTKDGKNIFKTQAEDLRKGVTIPYITKKDIEEIRIPILPISDLNILGNNSIEKSSKNELHDYLYLLKNFKEESKLLVKESVVAYGGLTFDTNDFFFNFINDRFNKIESQLEIVTIKLDKILDLKIDFDKIRSIPKGEEEILFKLCQKIDRKLDLMYSAEKVTIEEYIEEVKRWLNLWELLDIQSQKYLPLAELLFDELSMLKETDFSLFVLQYCRSIENEILKKLFEAFHITGIKDIDTDLLIKSDLENEKTNKFARKIKDENLLYTLGEMQFIMSMIKVNGNTLKTSLLLQYFRAFTISYFDERIIEKKFLKDLETITTEYRNKAAHPYSIDIETALKCKDLLRKSLNIFLESIKYKNDKLK